MRRIEDILDEYDSSNKTGQKKIILIKWFQKHPGKRFDRMEIYQELRDELDVGQGRVGQYLQELEEESVLESHGNQRKAYSLTKDIIIPSKYQILAALRHLSTIFDIERWGITGFLVVSTILWSFLTLPFWFFSAFMLLSPTNHIGPIHESEIFVFAIAMTIWLIIFIVSSYALHQFRLWWHSATDSR